MLGGWGISAACLNKTRGFYDYKFGSKYVNDMCTRSEPISDELKSVKWPMDKFIFVHKYQKSGMVTLHIQFKFENTSDPSYGGRHVPQRSLHRNSGRLQLH